MAAFEPSRGGPRASRRAWRPFDLMELPVADWQDEHVRACQVCRKKRHSSAVAYHEATHLAVATGVGLTVEFCSIDDTKQVEATALEAGLYRFMGLKRGTLIPAQITRLAEDSLQRAPELVLVALVAPSCVVTGDPDIDLYAHLEAEIGVDVAKRMGFDPDEILDRAKREVERTQFEIVRYAGRLALQGRIDLTDEELERRRRHADGGPLDPYKHSPEEDEGDQPWTIHVPFGSPIRPKPSTDDEAHATAAPSPDVTKPDTGEVNE